jgi:hypothetical protein
MPIAMAEDSAITECESGSLASMLPPGICVQTREEKPFSASLSDSVKAETVLVQVLLSNQRQ